MNTHLLVPGKWMAACGYDDKTRIFLVLSIEKYRNGRVTMVTVDRDGRPWVVHKEMREAVFVDYAAMLTFSLESMA